MKILIFLTLISIYLFGFGENIQSFEANFTQTVTDEENKVLVYKGTIYAKRPNLVLWRYKKPVNKQIYINKDRAVIIESELEQAILKHLQGEIDFFKILTSAKEIDETHYKTHYKDIEFIIKEIDGIIVSLSYEDQLENKIVITFSKQKQNIRIDNKIFTPRIPAEFDLIQE